MVPKKTGEPADVGICINCKREGITILCKKMCSACYRYHDDPEALAAAAARLKGAVIRKYKPRQVMTRSAALPTPVDTELTIVFDANDAGLYDDFLDQARFHRRTPENHAMFLIQRDVHEARALRREAEQ